MSQLRARDINTVSSCYTRRNLLSLVAPAAELPVYVRNCNDTIIIIIIHIIITIISISERDKLKKRKGGGRKKRNRLKLIL